MDDPARRKKRPVTYGKRAVKRLSGIDEIFSSPRPAEVSRPQPSATDVICNNGVKAQGSQTAKSTSAREGGAGGKERARSAMLKENTYSEEEEEESQAAQQLKTEARQFSKSRQDPAVFDIPSSSDDESEPSFIQASKAQKRKRGSAKATTLPKHKTPSDPPPPATEEMALKGKRSRPAQLQNQFSDLRSEFYNTSKLTSRAKITKATSRATSEKSVNKPAPPQKARNVPKTVPPSPPKPSDPPGMRTTRSQSRALSEEPSVQQRPTLSREPSLPVKSQNRNRPPTVDPRPKSRSSVGARPKSAPRQKENGRPLAAIVEPPSIADEPASTLTRKPSVLEAFVEASTSFYATEPLASSPEKETHDFDIILPDSSDDDMAKRPIRRKRLIDTLGTAPDYPRKKSRSLASSSDGSDSDTASHGQFSQPMGSQQPSLESQRSVVGTDSQNNSQDLGIMTRPKPVSNTQAGPRITYARQRSYLAEEPMDEMALLAQPLPALSSTSSYGVKRRLDHAKRKDETTDYDIAPSKGMMKSIHELRAAGETSRFMDDVEELLGDIEAKMPLSTRRSGYYELASKMRDKSFCLKFRAKSFDETLFSRLETETDDIVSFTITYIACCMLQDDRTPRTILQLLNNGATTMLCRMIASSRDIVAIAKDRKSNMSKAAQSQVADLRAMVEKTSFCSKLSSGGALSPQLLALKALDTIVRGCRQHGSTEDFLADGTLRKLVEVVKPFLRLSEYPKSSKIHNFKTFELCLSIMEAYTIGGHGSIGTQLSTAELVTVSTILKVVLSWGNTETLGSILLLVLRLDINITNNHSDLCESLAEADLVTAVVSLVQSKFADLSGVLDQQDRLLAIDLLVLSLGLLLNFAELSPKARAEVRANEVSDGISGIDALLNIFLDRLERIEEADSLEESTTNVAFGYLSVLLGELCQDDHIRYRVRARLPKSSLSSLVQSMEQFIAHHRMVDGMIEGEDDGDSAHAAFTKRLEGVVERLRSYA